ncbi:unnamed protein product [Oppiella nova]|uniref:Lysosome-associated membrane glycoprotein 5 n=1 Tax=Oppiella nova TaxID=334625 RepID=A0A7R9LNS5_9ACAR|nr:unnamed protein product [Oppiella nova]CAG2165480.1 unnamed protein product [Oppiella nova]
MSTTSVSLVLLAFALIHNLNVNLVDITVETKTWLKCMCRVNGKDYFQFRERGDLCTAQTAVQQSQTTANPAVNITPSAAPIVSTSAVPANAPKSEPNASPTTTIAPVSTTVTPVTPPPIPKPEQWNGNVTEGNMTCIQAQFAIQVVVKYNDTNGKELEGGFVIPKNATVSGNCVGQTDPLEVMIIKFTNVGNTSATLTLKFNQTEGNKTFYVTDVELSFNLTRELFPDFVDTKLYNTTVKASNPSADLFSVASAHAYTCATQSVQLETLPAGVKEIQIDFTSSKVAAFMDHTKGQWDSGGFSHYTTDIDSRAATALTTSITTSA